MTIMKKIFSCIFLLLIISFGLKAQNPNQNKKSKREEKKKKINAIIKQEEEGIIHYKTHWAGGFKLMNDGYGGFLEYAKAQSVKKSLLFQFEIDERKHSKELKLNSDYPNTSPLIFGKINFFYPVKLGVQKQYLLGNKGNRNGVAISCNFGGGVSLGLLRPYLYQVLLGDTATSFFSSDQVFYDTTSTGQNSLIGGPGLSQGWSKLKMTPGIYAKSALRFDYGRYNEIISAIEIGASVEYYAKKIPQMIEIKQNQMFLGLYVSLVFGNRKS